MIDLRPSQLSDLATVSSWIRSESECRLWSGARVSYPIDVSTLPDALEYAESESWSATSSGGVVAFGQLVPKPRGRLHLARLITAPEHRGEGLGRLIAEHLLENALARTPSAISLNVLPENEPALALYRSLGFAPAAWPPDERDSSSVYLEHAL